MRSVSALRILSTVLAATLVGGCVGGGTTSPQTDTVSDIEGDAATGDSDADAADAGDATGPDPDDPLSGGCLSPAEYPPATVLAALDGDPAQRGKSFTSDATWTVEGSVARWVPTTLEHSPGLRLAPAVDPGEVGVYTGFAARAQLRMIVRFITPENLVPTPNSSFGFSLVRYSNEGDRTAEFGADDGVYYAEIGPDGDTSGGEQLLAANPAEDQWHLAVLAFDAGTFEVCVDGVKVATVVDAEMPDVEEVQIWAVGAGAFEVVVDTIAVW